MIFEAEIEDIPNSEILLSKLRDFDTFDAILFFTGEFGEVSEFYSLEQSNFMHTLNINFFSQMQIISQLVTLGKVNHTKIIMTGGGGASSDLPKCLPYALSKSLIVKFAEVASSDLKQFNSSINVIAPGLMKTPLTQNILKKYRNSLPIELFNKFESLNESSADSREQAIDLLNFLIIEVPVSVTGRYISAPWDEWKILKDPENLNPEFGKLRRIDKLKF